MQLYLVQHGEAKLKAEDPDRPLTKQGQDETARVAAFARRAGIQVHQICHSGKLRAQQTAAILAEHLQPPGGVLALPGLAPQNDVGPVAELLSRETRPLMLVGHRPFMDRLAGLLVTGSADRAVVSFQKAGIVCLEGDPTAGTWVIRWVVTPDLVP